MIPPLFIFKPTMNITTWAEASALLQSLREYVANVPGLEWGTRGDVLHSVDDLSRFVQQMRYPPAARQYMEVVQ